MPRKGDENKTVKVKTRKASEETDSDSSDDSSDDSLIVSKKREDVFVFGKPEKKTVRAPNKYFLEDLSDEDDDEASVAPKKKAKKDERGGRERGGREGKKKKADGEVYRHGDDRDKRRKEKDRPARGGRDRRDGDRKEKDGGKKDPRRDKDHERSRRRDDRPRGDRDKGKKDDRHRERREERKIRPEDREGYGKKKVHSRFLGKGSYGEVFEHGGYAVKNFEDFSAYLQESVALRRLEDIEEVVRWESFDSRHFQVGMNRYTCNMRSVFKSLSDPEKKSMLLDILQGLHAIHSFGLVHGDIKMGNILVENGRAYIGDLGFISKIGYSRIHRTTPNARDPNPQNTYAHDMFSFGVILCKIFGEFPHKLDKVFDYDFFLSAANQIPDKYRSYRVIALNLLSPKHSDRHRAQDVIVILGGTVKNYSVPELPHSSSSSPYSHQMSNWKCHQISNGCRCLNYILNKFRPQEHQVQDYVDAVIWMLLSCFSSSRNIDAFTAKIPDHQIMNEILSDKNAVKYILE